LMLSENRQAFEGFNFNRDYPFNTVLRILPRWELDREQLKGVVTFPRINTDIDLLNIQKLPFFRLIVVVGAVSDLTFNPVTDVYEAVVDGLHGHSITLNGKWNSTNAIVPEHTMTVQFPEEQISLLTENVTVLLSLAVEFGNIGYNIEPVEVKYAGCGKVVGVK